MRQKAVLHAAGNRYCGSGDFAYYDPTGALVAGGTFTITAQRVDVQAPSANWAGTSARKVR